MDCTRLFHSCGLRCWFAARSGEWQPEQTLTVRSCPGPGGKCACAEPGGATEPGCAAAGMLDAWGSDSANMLVLSPDKLKTTSESPASPAPMPRPPVATAA